MGCKITDTVDNDNDAQAVVPHKEVMVSVTQ